MIATLTDKELIEDMKRIANGIELFLDSGDEVSIQIFKECIKEAFKDTNRFKQTK